PAITKPPSPKMTSTDPSPSTAAELRSRIVGAWQLESYMALPVDPNLKPIHPMTKHVTGIIMYTPDGYMSAQMCIPGQTPAFSRWGGDTVTDEMWAESAKRYIAYSGPYFISEGVEGEKPVLKHGFQVSSAPGPRGGVQERKWRFEEGGELLVLGSDHASEYKGDQRRPELKWRRMKDNSVA
ncbi:hypothetical protein K490DRAFT_18226, partial [Saccharata proteae CBS 121410]